MERTGSRSGAFRAKQGLCGGYIRLRRLDRIGYRLCGGLLFLLLFHSLFQLLRDGLSDEILGMRLPQPSVDGPADGVAKQHRRQADRQKQAQHRASRLLRQHPRRRAEHQQDHSQPSKAVGHHPLVLQQEQQAAEQRADDRNDDGVKHGGDRFAAEGNGPVQRSCQKRGCTEVNGQIQQGRTARRQRNGAFSAAMLVDKEAHRYLAVLKMKRRACALFVLKSFWDEESGGRSSAALAYIQSADGRTDQPIICQKSRTVL